MPDIDQFLDDVASGPYLDLARVNISGGGAKPFYCAQLRSFWRENEPDTNQVVAESFGLRSMLVDADEQEVDLPREPNVRLNSPNLLRVYPRPRKYAKSPSNRLFLWSSSGNVVGQLTASDAASDLMVAPHTGWPDSNADNIRIPHLRLVEGRASVEIDLAEPALKSFLTFNKIKHTLFGGLTVKTTASKLKAVLVAEGIEFEASLPDPTRDFTGGQNNGLVTGTFRLECDTRGDEPQYLVRLVGADAVAITATEDRIAEALSGLLTANAPVTVRYDRRPVVPPIFWPLRQINSRLRLLPAGADFEMGISDTAVDARIRTGGLFDDESGLASLFTKSVSWKRSAPKTLAVTIVAGKTPAVPQTTKIAFAKTAHNRWETQFGTIVDRPYSAPLGPVADRLLPIYQTGGGVGPDVGEAPYVFIPVNEGWLQLPIEASVAPDPAGAASAMSGRIFVSDEGSNRGLVVDGAASIELNVLWTDGGATVPTVSGTTLDIADAKGRLLGFLYVAETSPSPSEALPTLRGGPAATRDLPLWFGNGAPSPALAGKFTWDSATKAFDLSVDVGVGDKPALVWLPAGASPFVTNIPLTRTLPSASYPSASRGLVPQEIKAGQGSIRLKSKSGEALPSFSSAGTTWFSTLAVKDGYSLVLPTLAGTEFAASSDDVSKGLDQARLRFDLPLLDELFAWSDPPKKAQNSTAPIDPVSLPTALEPERLRGTWQSSLNRVALTRTQDAALSGWVATGTASSQQVEALVAPYVWTTSLKIEPTAPDAWGRYQLDRVTYRLDSAAEGLGGATPVDFEIAGRSIRTGGGRDFSVAGNAANLFAHSSGNGQPDLIWDSRGFGQAAAAAGGRREASQLIANGRARPSLAALDQLWTLQRVLHLHVKNEGAAWAFDRPLSFFARDLPTSGGVFDGSKNPVESAVGANGQAFDKADFPFSLHEWRLFEEPGKKQDGYPWQQRSHDLRWGPFSFKPLRLIEVISDEAGDPSSISVVGSLRLAPRRGPESPDGPFGEDVVYLREDLFQLTLKRDGEHWDQEWRGVAATINGDRVKFAPKAHPIVTLEVDLRSEVGFIKSKGDVSARIDLDIVSLVPTIAVRLFGADYTLSGTTTANGGGFVVDLKVAQPTLPGMTRAMFHPRKAELKVTAEESLLAIDGRLVVHDSIGTGEILSVDSSRTRWLGVTARPVRPTVDHATGSVTWDAETQLVGNDLPFGLVARSPINFKAAFVFIASERTVAGDALGSVQIGSAWAHCTMIEDDARDHMIDYLLMASLDGERRHSLEVSWSKMVDSPIAWPQGQVLKDRSTPLPPTWLRPEDADQTTRTRSIYIADDENCRLRHRALLRFNAHRIDVDDLTVVDGALTAFKPVRLLVVTDHLLVTAAGESRAWWTTLDHVVLTSRSLMAKECAQQTFAPLENDNRYRGKSARMKHNGVAPFSLASAGFHDRLLLDTWWTADDQRLIFIGGAVTQFHIRDGVAAYTAVFPWIDIRNKDGKPVDPLNVKSGTWTVAAADLWPATAIASGTMPPIIVGRRMQGPEIQGRFSSLAASDKSGSEGPERVIPLEQAYFEAPPRVSVELDAAPLFLRAMMAVSARLEEDSDVTGRQWDATTVDTGRPRRTWSSATRPSSSAVRVQVRAGVETVVPVAETMATAHLIALSSRNATRLESYRRIDVNASDDASDRASRDEIVELATDLDPEAVFGVRVAVMRGFSTGYAFRRIPAAFDTLAKGAALTEEANDIGPSAALGWPSSEGMADIHQLHPSLGEELPVLSHQAGFAGRFQMYGWPAYAPERREIDITGNGGPYEALYLSFGQHVVYDRQTAAKLAFDGPTARHLLPAVARRRAPLGAQTEKMLGSLIRSPDDIHPPPAAPILPPAVERGTIGRRPGVMEVVVASMTVPGDAAAFDPTYDRFGRPANAGPTAAHQLRNPRSPILPLDEVEVQSEQELPAKLAEMRELTLDLRRRTYVSVADLEAPAIPGLLRARLFQPFDGSADIVRFARNDDRRHDRLAFIIEREEQNNNGIIGDTWTGSLDIRIESTSTEGAKQVPARRRRGRRTSVPTHRLVGWLEIGIEVFAAQVGPKPDGSLDFDLNTPPDKLNLAIADLRGVRSALQHATADTSIRVVLEIVEIGGASAANTLPVSPRWQAILPLMLDPGERRVVPISTRTIVFGDASYDRQLASQAALGRVQVPYANQQVLLLAADRKEYDLGQAIRFAGGYIDNATGEFALLTDLTKALSPRLSPQEVDRLESYTLTISRLPPQLPNGDQPPPESLGFDGDIHDSYVVKGSTAFELALSRLVSVDRPSEPCPLRPGDRVEIIATVTQSDGSDPKSARVQVDIVAEPVIAPPPAVYTVISSSLDLKVARSVLHASGPLPQKIEFPDLLRDLALGHVRRRALFVWAYASANDANEYRLDLVKFDRSGGAQLPTA